MTNPLELPGLTIGPELAGVTMTAEEFDAADDWDPDYCYELINHVLVVTPLPAIEERDSTEYLGYLLRLYQERHPLGKAVDKTIYGQTVPTTPNRRRADRVIWAGLGRLPSPKTDLPQVLVEFVSAGKRDWLRDYVEKLAEYMEAGVQEYWIIDRFRRTLTVFRNTPDEPQKIVVTEKDSYETPLLPGFVLQPARLFALSDAWQASG